MTNFHLPSDPSRWADPAARGNCFCRPSTPECAAVLRRFGLEGIEYKDNEPDFRPCAIAEVKIPMMTHKRRNTESFRTKQERRISHKQYTYEGMSAEQVAAEVASQTAHDYAAAGNFDQADAMLSQQWSAQQRDGHAWSAKMVEKYRSTYKLTWHETQDLSTILLVPKIIHDNFPHMGGTGILNKRYGLASEVNHAFAESEGTYNPQGDEEYERYVQGNRSKKKPSQHYDPLHVLMTIGLIAGFVVSYLVVSPQGLVNHLAWGLAAISPYIALCYLCIRCGGLPRFLRNQTGGIILSCFFVINFILIPFLSGALFTVYLVVMGICLALLAGNVGTAVGPTGRITIHRTDADGFTTVQDKDVYGDMDYALRSTETDLRNEGYNNIRTSK